MAAATGTLLVALVSGATGGAEEPAAEALRHVSKRYRPPSEALQRAHTATPADAALRDECSEWLASVLHPRWLPPDGTAWPYLRLSADEVESLSRNYFFLKYRRDGTDIWVRGYSFGMYAVLTPPAPLGSRALDEALADARRRRESNQPPRRDTSSLPAELKQLLSQLWATYLRVPLPPLDEGPRRRRPVIHAAPSCIQMHAVDLDVPTVAGPCHGELWTDGYLVGISFLKPSGYFEAAITAVWGGTPSPPDVAPLNPSEVLLEDMHRYTRHVDGEEVHTNSPGPVASAAIQVVYRKPWRVTSAYADCGDLLSTEQLRGYSVKAENGGVPQATWRLAEFHALTAQTLYGAIATTFQPELTTDLRHAQTQRRAWVGLRALHKDYGSFVERYRRFKCPPECAKERQAVDEALAVGEASWELIETHWGEALAADADSDPGAYLEAWTAFAQRLQADGMHPGQARAGLRQQQEQIDRLLKAPSATEAAVVDG